MYRWALVAALLCASAVVARAEPPRSSPRPVPRPVVSAPASVRIASLAPLAGVVPQALPTVSGGGAPVVSPWPRRRPLGRDAPPAPLTAISPQVVASAAAPARSPRPEPRPLRAAAVPAALAVPSTTIATASALAPETSVPAPRRGLAALFAPRPPRTARGSVCGDPKIAGTDIAVIPAALSGCGLADGVSVTAVAGVALSVPARIDCTTAKALKTWVEEGVKPAIGRRGGGLVQLTVVASYDCRPRNNVRGARISEHGAGRAVDVAGFTLADGSTLTVLRDWGRESTLMRAIHASACGPFGTVLGPRADAYHRDHFHVDTARYRSGSYCR